MKTVRVEGFAGADHPVPPAETARCLAVAFLGAKPVARALRRRRSGVSRGVRVAAERMTHKNDIVAGRRQRSVRLIGDANGMKGSATFERYRMRKIQELRVDRAGRAGSGLRRRP